MDRRRLPRYRYLSAVMTYVTDALRLAAVVAAHVSNRRLRPSDAGRRLLAPFRTLGSLGDFAEQDEGREA